METPQIQHPCILDRLDKLLADFWSKLTHRLETPVAVPMATIWPQPTQRSTPTKQRSGTHKAALKRTATKQRKLRQHRYHLQKQARDRRFVHICHGMPGTYLHWTPTPHLLRRPSHALLSRLSHLPKVTRGHEEGGPDNTRGCYDAARHRDTGDDKTLLHTPAPSLITTGIG
ncbi:Hypothetical predicted protein [Pelobates cultripes]|uniref:Uncharacterized protein n=1 Tax=Pelobates cultripes TaxID=61616 RepID=A0AAD1VMG0_PELCU|nr:Hypothetical predicted protein [Pelobates cultripes]